MNKNKRQKQKSSAFEYFSVTVDDKFFICQVTKDGDEEICGSNISAYCGEGTNAPTRTSNLKRHLQRYHPMIFKTVTEKDKQASEVEPKPSSSQCQAPVTKFFKAENITVAMTAEKFKRCIIEMVYSNSMPLTFFSSAAFVSLNGEMAGKFGISLERSNIRNMVLQEAKKQKDMLKDILVGRFVFLKMDGCTRHRVNYFAINAQFIDDKKKVVTRTLAVKDTEAHHTSSYLQDLVMDVLSDFGINKQQILCIVTDNATNMVSTVNKLNEDIVAYVYDDNEASEEELNDNLDGFVDAALNISQIHHMRCAVHTLQLAIRDGLEDYDAKRLIAEVRSVVVFCRTPKLDAILKRRAGKGAILDQATRWGSTYLMIERIIELKHILTDMANPAATITHAQWEEIEKLECLLRHPYTATKNFQAVDLTPSMFYKEWCNLIFRFSKSNCKIADGIKDSMIRRESTLLDNDILLAGIYVDPMVRVLLTKERQIRAKDALYELAIRMKGIEVQNEEGNDYSSSNIIPEDVVVDDFEKYLDEQEQFKRRRLNLVESNEDTETPTVLAKFKIDFYQALKEVEKFDRSSNLSIKDAIPKYPEIIQDAALIVTALPPTQVSVERLFSALRIIRSDLRASMKPDIIEAVLFLKTNAE